MRRAAPWIVQEFVYPHAHVELNFFRVFAFDGEPVGHDGQAFAWQRPGAFDVAPLLPANTRVMAALALPPVLGDHLRRGTRRGCVPRACARRVRARARLVQVREKDWPVARRDAFVRALLPLARAAGARVVLNGTAEDARRLGLDGVHWTAQALADARERPADLIVGASCHDAADLARAARLDVDYAVLGPVRETRTHPGATPLGWDGFERAIAGTRVPVYALGGLAPGDLAIALERGAQGIAMMRGAWD